MLTRPNASTTKLQKHYRFEPTKSLEKQAHTAFGSG